MSVTRLIWADETTDLAVHVNGGLIEITLPDGWSGRCLPSEITGLGAAFTTALAEANAWAARWNPDTRTYNEVTSDPEPRYTEADIRAIVREEIEAERSARAELGTQRREQLRMEAGAALEAFHAVLDGDEPLDEGRSYLRELLDPAIALAISESCDEEISGGRHRAGDLVEQGVQGLGAGPGVAVHESSPSFSCGGSSVGAGRPGGVEGAPPPGPGLDGGGES